jgi:hypothetical protein
MTIRNLTDQGFDDFRKERKRMQAKLGPQQSTLGYENPALRELEQAEEREARDQQLTREVHDFFQAATRQAASIVERVAKDALQETGERVEQEMESFLIDSLARMNTFIVTVLKERRGVAETEMEPSLGNIVGKSLDDFRWEGTADVLDRHIGQDPFETPVDEVQREFREQVGHTEGGDGANATPIDQHLVAAVQDEDKAAADAPAVEAKSMPVAPTKRPTAAAPAPALRTTAAAPATPPAPSTGDADLDRFKEALKTLVRQGTMTRDEARAAWQTRMKSTRAK